MRYSRFFIVIGLCVTLSACAERLPSMPPSAKIEVYKAQRALLLIGNDGEIIKPYKVALGFDPVGHKTQEGDGKTPEGKYFIEWRNNESKFHRSLKISYPNKQDRAQAKERNVSPGGMIMIHGEKDGYGWRSQSVRNKKDTWTEGCIAVTNREMDEIWVSVRNGTPIEIFP